MNDQANGHQAPAAQGEKPAPRAQSLTRNVAHNTIIQFGGKIVGMVIGLVSFGMMAAYLHGDGVGGYTTVISFLSIFGILADMGLYIVLVKELTRKGAREEEVIGNIVTLRVVVAAVILALAPLVAMLPIFPYPHAVRVGIAIGTASFFFISINQLLVGVFQKYLQMDKVAIGEVLGRVVLLGGTWFVIRENAGLQGIIAAIVLGSAANFAYVFWSARRLVRIRWMIDLAVWRRLIAISIPIALSVVLNLVYLKVGAVFLSVFKSQSEVGMFGAPFKVLEIIVAFPAIFAGLLTPPLSEAHSYDNKEKFTKIYKKAFDALSIIVFPMVGVTLWYAPQIMRLIRADFPGTDVVLRVLIFAIGMIFFGNLFGNTVVAIDKQRQMVAGYAVCAVLAVVVNFVLIRQFSSVGAAYSTVFSETFVTVFAALMVYRATRVAPDFRVFAKSLLAAGAMMACFWLLPTQSLFVGAPVGLLAYVVVMVVIRGITPDVIREIVSLRRAPDVQTVELDEHI